MKLTKEQIREIEKQLSCPCGEMGLQVAENMHLTNFSMTAAAIKALELNRGEVVLEIGHGNAAHLEFVLNQSDEIKYYGLEISQTMHEEAKRLNENLAKKYDFYFEIYKGESIPFTDNVFDKIFTVNTIYFWKNPLEFFQEIYRVLKPKGIVVLAFAHRDYMEALPFVGTYFTLYDEQKLKDLIVDTPFYWRSSYFDTEEVISKTGEPVVRGYQVICLEKN